MQTTSKHTPLSYRYDDKMNPPQIRGQKGYMGSDGLTIAFMCNNSGMPIGQPKANAEFIVRACNSHYELLEALKRALSFKCCDYQNGSGWEKMAKSAIAKAEGK